jgi:hypothetical protein
MGKQETQHHVITTEKESLVPLDPSGLIGGMIGHETDKTTVVDKETGNVGVGRGKDSEDQAWRDLRSQNEASKR